MEQKPLFTRITANRRFSIDVCNYVYPETGVVNPYFIHKYNPRVGCWVFLKAYKTLHGAAQYYNRITGERFDYKGWREAQG